MEEFIVSDPKEMDWAYDLLLEPKSTWKEGGFEKLVDRLRKTEQSRVEHYARRVIYLEEKLFEKDVEMDNRTIVLLAAIGLLVTPTLASIVSNLIKK